MKEIFELIVAQSKQIKLPWIRSIIGGVILVSVTYIYSPIFRGGYLQIPPTTALFEFEKPLTNCVLVFDRDVFVVSYSWKAYGLTTNEQTVVVRKPVSQFDLTPAGGRLITGILLHGYG